MKRIIFPIAIIFSLQSFPQDPSRISGDTTWKKPVDSSSVIIHKDPRLDWLIKKQVQINEETSREARKAGKGFRLMIINTNKREEAIAAKTKVYTYFPELKSYLIYQSPYFKLKVGNFKERKDAETYQKKLNRYFPKGVFVMPDNIEINPEKDKEQDANNQLP